MRVVVVVVVIVVVILVLVVVEGTSDVLEVVVVVVVVVGRAVVVVAGFTVVVFPLVVVVAVDAGCCGDAVVVVVGLKTSVSKSDSVVSFAGALDVLVGTGSSWTISIRSSMSIVSNNDDSADSKTSDFVVDSEASPVIGTEVISPAATIGACSGTVKNSPEEIIGPLTG